MRRVCLPFLTVFFSSAASLTTYYPRQEPAPTQTGLPNSKVLLELLVGRQCPVLTLDPKASYQLSKPYDPYRPPRYPCGVGPHGPLSIDLWDPNVHVVNASDLIDILTNASRRIAERNETRVERPVEKYLNSTNSNSTNSTLPCNATAPIKPKTKDWCLLVEFYAPSCPFSAKMAPLINALPRIFPRLHVAAVDATEMSKLNTRYGIAGTPTILLWQNGKAIARYEESSERGIQRLIKFIVHWTDLDTVGEEEVLDTDMVGPLAVEPLTGTDWYFIASWAFITFCAGYYGSQSGPVQRLGDTVRRYWREAAEEAVVLVEEEGEGGGLEEPILEAEAAEMVVEPLPDPEPPAD